jgi:hypothetical protein
MRFGDFIRKAVVSQLLRAVLSGALGAVSGITRRTTRPPERGYFARVQGSRSCESKIRQRNKSTS